MKADHKISRARLQQDPIHLAPTPSWYAIHTRAKHEKHVALEISRKGLNSFTPTLCTWHRWSDRVAKVDVALFPCYSFIQCSLTPVTHCAVLETPGVLGFVSFNAGPVPIPDAQIEAVQAVLRSKLPVTTHGVVRLGDRVRVRSGALRGIEGVLIRANGQQHTLVISVPLIEHSMAVAVDSGDVERI